MFNEDDLKIMIEACIFLRAFHRDHAPFMTDHHHKQIDRLNRALNQLEALQRGDQVAILWDIEDVMSLGEDPEGEQRTDISMAEARATLAAAVANHDANYGITWDVLWDTLLNIKDERSEAGTE